MRQLAHDQTSLKDCYEGVIAQLQEASLVRTLAALMALVIADPVSGEKVSPRGRSCWG